LTVVCSVAPRISIIHQAAAITGATMSNLLTHPGLAIASREETLSAQILNARMAQRKWAEVPVYLRLYALRRLRYCLAEQSSQLAASIHRAGRSVADTLAAEVLPLLDACKFLESEADEILRTRREPGDLRPLWMQRVSVETRREPFGVVLLIAPSNYPLLLPGVQCLQALAAGNAVVWKPGLGGGACAAIFAEAFAESGADSSLLVITDEKVEAARGAISAGVDKVVLTGSAVTGAKVLAQLAPSLTPSTMELSGCDAMFVLMDANLDRVAEALAFSCRLNASATCMAARRVLVPLQLTAELERKLAANLLTEPQVQLPIATRALVDDLVHDALLLGARMVFDGRDGNLNGPVVLSDVRPDMRIADADVFAPVLGLMPFRYEQEAVEANRACSYALSVSIFGSEKAARALATQVKAGCVIINDVIAPSVDPRVCFGGRGRSGFGVTRGREGLLEMTTPKSVILRRGDDRMHLRLQGEEHRRFFAGYINAVHASGLRERLRGAAEAIKGLPALLRRKLRANS
jgi:acyl-CoA reductase-like NAD-dependent aldehyde dehydrogenase